MKTFELLVYPGQSSHDRVTTRTNVFEVHDSSTVDMEVLQWLSVASYDKPADRNRVTESVYDHH